MFGQMFAQLRSARAAAFRTANQPYRVQFAGEGGIDAGGLFRDSLAQVCTELQSPHLPLLLPCPNARHGVGVVRPWLLWSQCGRCIDNTRSLTHPHTFRIILSSFLLVCLRLRAQTLDKFLPNPACDDLGMYTFIGRLMGMAIRTRTYLELDLPSLVWKPLVGQVRALFCVSHSVSVL